MYDELSEKARIDLACRAALETSRRRRQDLKRAPQLHNAIVTLREKMSPSVPGLPNTVSGCRYKERYRARLKELWESLETTCRNVVFLHGREGPPEEPVREVQQAICDQITLDAADFPALGRCWWADIVCDLRDRFRDSLLWWSQDEHSDADPDVGYCPMMMNQLSKQVHFLRVEKVASEEDINGVGGVLTLAPTSMSFSRAWKVTSHIPWATAVDIDMSDTGTLWVLPTVTWAGEFVLSDRAPTTFEEFTRGHLTQPHVATNNGPRSGRARAAPGFLELVLEEFPWFTEADVHEAMRHRNLRGLHPDDDDVVPPIEAPPPAPRPLLPEDEAQAVIEKLREMREEWAWDEADQFSHFYEHMRGGLNTARDKGKVSDCVAVIARKHAKPWCRRVGCALMRSFSYKEHTRPIAHLLVREWIRKQEHYYRAWLDGPGGDFNWGDVAPYLPTDEFWEALHAVPAMSPTFARFHELVDWQPA